MELRTVNGRLELGGVFKLFATGYLLGAGVLFVPLFALVELFGLVTGAPVPLDGQAVSDGTGPLVGLMMLIMAPIVVAMQSVMFGGLAVLGIWLYQKRRIVSVIAQEAAN